MKILLTGATGYIGKRLLPVLLEEGHEVICCVRDLNRFVKNHIKSKLLQVIECDFLDEKSLSVIPNDIDAAYYLIHSMSAPSNDFEVLESKSAQNFKNRISATKAKQVIYLSGIVNEKQLSKHLRSRKNVEEILSSGSFQLTTLRAGIIVGSGSASFEIIRDLVEKLPIMVAPKWLKTKSQPIAIRNVIEFLKGVLLNKKTYDLSYDIGGNEVLTYKDMLMQFAEVRNMKRTIITVPVMTPRLSSYWLYFVTSTSYKLAVNLVNSMKIEVICKENDLSDHLNIHLISYKEAVKLAFDKISGQNVLSSWTDALSTDVLNQGIDKLIEVPKSGCFKDQKVRKIKDQESVINKIWSIGGKNGWYYGNNLWKFRGFLDKIAGGVGLRRGRKSQVEISAGDTLDFWRVVHADKENNRLLLYAEMKLPGEAWLEFLIDNQTLYQTATFRPKGVWGRLYWYAALPLHFFVFNGMISKIAK